MGGGSKAPPPPDKVTSVTEVPDYVKPYARSYLSRAAGLSNEQYNPYPGQRIAELDPAHYQGLQQTVDTAQNGIMPAAANQFANTINGNFLNANPYIDQMFNQAAQGVMNNYTQSVMPGIDAAANRANAMGGSAYQEYSDMGRFDLGQNLNNLATQIYGGNYANERAMMNNAMMNAGQFQQGMYGDAQALMGVGDVFRSYDQDLLNQEREDWERAYNQQYTNLDVLGNALGISMGAGGTTQTTQPSYYQSSPLAGAIGGGLLGYGAGSLMGGGGFSPSPYNVGGAALGALGGGFF